MTLRVVADRFTTQDGSWDVDATKPYGIDQAHRDRYEAGRLIPGSGGDHHIFVKSPADSTVTFSSDGVEWLDGAVKDGWWHMPMYHGSAYYPDEGQRGPWRVRVDEEIVADGLGLPNGLHVSTFLVVEDVADIPVPLPPTEPPSEMSAADAVERAINYLAQAQQLLDYALEAYRP